MKKKLDYYKEWIRKADADRRAAERTLADAARHKDQAEIACFHAQQCVEKYLKAVLAKRNRSVPKAHDLLALHYLLGKENIFLGNVKEEDLRLLNQYSVEIRYPGATASLSEARLTLKKMRKAALALTAFLGCGD